jgi:hypothetical protein
VGKGKPQQQFGAMFLRRISGDQLISAHIALEIARLVLKEQSGQNALKKSEPLLVVEDGDEWIIQGSAPNEATTTRAAGIALDGGFRMRISKYDGQILDCVFVIDISAQQRSAPDVKS